MVRVKKAGDRPKISLSKVYLVMAITLAIFVFLHFVSGSATTRSQSSSSSSSSSSSLSSSLSNKQDLLLRSKDNVGSTGKNMNKNKKINKKINDGGDIHVNNSNNNNIDNNNNNNIDNNNNNNNNNIETLILRSGIHMPAIGFGTCCRSTARGPPIYESTLLYLQNGGRLIDTAMAYRNHNEIGNAILQSGVPRKDIWITTKISVHQIGNEMAPDKATYQAVTGALQELKLQYIDLFLIHSQKLGKQKTIQIWEGLIKAKQDKFVRSIGVSNFNGQEIRDLQEATGELPEVSQIQYHPWTAPDWKQQVRWQTQQNIVTTAYTSLGGKKFPKDPAASSWPPIVSQLAKQKFAATEAQVMLRWALRQGVAVIPGATSEQHIRENLSVPKMEDFTDDDARAIEESDPPPEWFDQRRGPVKYLPGSAKDAFAWQGDHTNKH